MNYMELYCSSQDPKQKKLVKRILDFAQELKDEGVDAEKIARALEAASAFVYLGARQDAEKVKTT